MDSHAQEIADQCKTKDFDKQISGVSYLFDILPSETETLLAALSNWNDLRHRYHYHTNTCTEEYDCSNYKKVQSNKNGNILFIFSSWMPMLPNSVARLKIAGS